MKKNGSLGIALLISLAFSACNNEPAAEEKWAMLPMVMVDGTLYLDTGLPSSMEGRCGVMDGEITSSVDGTEKPTADDQSNFGTGYGYQYGMEEGTIEIYMNENWRIFATEDVRQEMQLPTEKCGEE